MPGPLSLAPGKPLRPLLTLWLAHFLCSLVGAVVWPLLSSPLLLPEQVATASLTALLGDTALPTCPLQEGEEEGGRGLDLICVCIHITLFNKH